MSEGDVMTKPTLPDLPRGIRTLTNTEASFLQLEHGDLGTPEKCVTCRGSGSFLWWAPGGRQEPVEWECRCVDQWVLRRYLLHSGIGLTYARLGWLDYAGARSGSDAAANWLDDVDYTMQTGMGLTLYGPHGTGKTLIASLLLKGMLGLGFSGYMTTLAGMIDMFASGWKSPEAQERFAALCKGTDVLLLDDVGQERHEQKTFWDSKTQDMKVVRSSMALARSSLDEVLRYRLAHSKVTIVTTNRDPNEDFYGDYSPAIASLIQERSHLCRLDGDDFRRGGLEQRLVQERKQRLIRPIMIA